MPLKVSLIDGEHHLHHLARGLLVSLVVLFKGILHVAELAFHTERCCDELHGGKDLFCRNPLLSTWIFLNCSSARRGIVGSASVLLLRRPTDHETKNHNQSHESQNRRSPSTSSICSPRLKLQDFPCELRLYFSTLPPV
jgi:hypothetical protein